MLVYDYIYFFHLLKQYHLLVSLNIHTILINRIGYWFIFVKSRFFFTTCLLLMESSWMGCFFFSSKSPFPLFEDFFFAHTWTLHLFSSCNKWRWWSINTKLRCSSSFYRSTDPWSSCTFLFCFTLSLLISTHSCSVVKSSRLPANIAAYLVSIGRLLCLAFLYGWRFLIKISLDWPLTLTTQPSTSKLSDNRVLGPPDPVILLNASIAIGIPILASNDPRNPPVCVFVGFTITFPPDCTALLFLR